MRDHEDRWMKLEEMDWKGHPSGVWLSDVGEEAGQGQSRAVVGV